MGELQVLVQSEGDIGFQLQLQELATRQMHARSIFADPLIRDLKLELLEIRLAMFGITQAMFGNLAEQDEKEVR
jgi:hypothetical protein